MSVPQVPASHGDETVSVDAAPPGTDDLGTDDLDPQERADDGEEKENPDDGDTAGDGLSLQELEQHIAEAEQLHQDLTARLDDTARD